MEGSETRISFLLLPSFSFRSSFPPLSLPSSKELQEIHSTRHASQITQTTIDQDVETHYSLSVGINFRLIRLILVKSYAHGQPLTAPPMAAPPSSQPTRKCPARGRGVPNYAVDTMRVSSPLLKLVADVISSVSSAMSSIYSDEEKDSEEEDSDDDDVAGYKGQGSDDDDYVEGPAPEIIDDEEDSIIMELAAPMPIASAPQKTSGQTTAPAPAIIPIPTPAPAPALAPAPAPAPVVIATPSSDIRLLLEAYGEAVLRCSLDHTPATAAKLEDNIAKASDAVVQFHKATILKVEKAPSEIDIELLGRLENAIIERQELEQELVTKSQEITQKDEEAKWKDVALDNLKSLYTDSQRLEVKLRAQLSKIEKETEAKRKRVEESVFKASKKANV
jgi:hypothetical protein